MWCNVEGDIDKAEVCMLVDKVSTVGGGIGEGGGVGRVCFTGMLGEVGKRRIE